MNKKAQGLPLSFIVIAAIVLIVLILVVVFTVGGLGSAFRGISAQQSQDLSSVQAACQTACARQQVNPSLTPTQFKSSDYCTKDYAIDNNGDGQLNSTETNYNCPGSPISVPCDVRIGGVAQTC